MTKEEMISRVASGLRKMDTKPDALLYFDSYRFYFTCDIECICEIPILHTGDMLPMSDKMLSYECPFYPVFKKDNDGIQADYFIRGFEDNL